MDRDTGRSKGFGFVEMGSDQEAQAAIAAMSGKEFDGRALKVNEAKPREMAAAAVVAAATVVEAGAVAAGAVTAEAVAAVADTKRLQKKGTGPIVRSTLWAVPATGPVPFFYNIGPRLTTKTRQLFLPGSLFIVSVEKGV